MSVDYCTVVCVVTLVRCPLYKRTVRYCIKDEWTNNSNNEINTVLIDMILLQLYETDE